MIFSRPIGRPIPLPAIAMVGLLLGLVALAPLGAASSASAADAGAITVDIAATSTLSFVPDAFSVAPGAAVHLVITQEADFDHTFTLASLVNYTIPSTNTSTEVAAFFDAHPPIVNVSLGSTVGAEFFENFTAPSGIGTYEFVCLIHFPTMTGVMTDAVASPTSGTTSLSPTDWILIGAAAGVVLIVGAAALVLHRRRASPPAGPGAAP